MENMKYVDEFIGYCRFEKTLSSKTIKAYTTDLVQFQNYLKNETSTKELICVEKQILRSYIQLLQSSYKIKSVKRKVATLKSFYSYLEFEDLIVVSPFKKLRLRLKEPFLLPNVLNINEVQSILTKVNDQFLAMNFSKGFGYYEILKHKVVIELLFNTGLRVSELCHLKRSDISLDTFYIKVNGKGKKQRQIYIVSEHLIQQLKELDEYYYNRQQQRLFFFINKRDARLSEQSVRNIVKKYAAHLDKNVTPHMFRHTFATTLLEQGVDITYIQHLLGHHSVVVTQIYTHVNKEKQKEILIEKLPWKTLTIVNEG